MYIPSNLTLIGGEAEFFPSEEEPFLEFLREKIPCPWGNLATGKGIINDSDRAESAQIPYVPRGLVFGEGHPPLKRMNPLLSVVGEFRTLIWSDKFNPSDSPSNDLQEDLEVLSIHRARFNAIFLNRMFDLETYSVEEIADGFNDLLMPGGIVVY